MHLATNFGIILKLIFMIYYYVKEMHPFHLYHSYVVHYS